MNLPEKVDWVRTHLFDPGEPLSEWTSLADGGSYQSFQNVNFYQNPQGECFEVHGAILGKYVEFHETLGDLGYPTSDEQDNANAEGGKWNAFQNGYITWDPVNWTEVTLTADTGETEAPTQEGADPIAPSGDASGYAAQAQTFYDEIVAEHPALAAPSPVVSGHSNSQEVFSPEFDRLQSLLTRLTFWGQQEETARQFLAEYATVEVGKLTSFIPDHVQYQINRIGLSESNASAMGRYAAQLKKDGDTATLVPSLGDFGAAQGAANWCRQTQSSAFVKSLAAHGVAMNKSWDGWIKEGGRTLTKIEDNLQPGDWFTMIGSGSPISGHIGGIIHHDGETLYYVSGNAGGGAASGDGTVRIDRVRVTTPPSGYRYMKYKDGEPKQPGITNPAEKGVVWLVTAIKLSNVDFQNLDSILDDADALAAAGLVKK